MLDFMIETLRLADGRSLPLGVRQVDDSRTLLTGGLDRLEQGADSDL
jgi:hypothetical protein